MVPKSVDDQIKSLRERVLERRRKLSDSERIRLGREICGNFLEELKREVGDLSHLAIATYRPLKSEFPVDLLERELLRFPITLCFPRIQKSASEKRIEMVPMCRPGEAFCEEWVEGPYGIQEPPLHRDAIDPKDLDLVLVPGVVFGRQGERIGMGAGYYDRYFSALPAGPLRVALAFGIQIEERVPQKEWDQPVDWLLSEGHTYRAAGVEEKLQRIKEKERDHR